MRITREEILRRTHCGLRIYSHVMRQYYPGETVLSISGKDCQPAKNPFNGDEHSLWIKIIDGCANHLDADQAIENGNAFDFAALHYKAEGEELLKILNDELHLKIGAVHPFYDRFRIGKVPERKTMAPQISIPAFSFFNKPILNVHPNGNRDLLEIYDLIKGDTYKDCTEKLRAIKDVKEARKFKAFHFDYATFSGSFSKRSDKDLNMHSRLITIDFDHIPNLSDLKEKLLNDKYFETQLLFISPSGDGLKWIVSIDLTEYNHQQWFKAIANYLRSTYALEVDQSGKDVSRACFIPHDPNAYINPKYFTT